MTDDLGWYKGCLGQGYGDHRSQITDLDFAVWVFEPVQGLAQWLTAVCSNSRVGAGITSGHL